MTEVALLLPQPSNEMIYVDSRSAAVPPAERNGIACTKAPGLSCACKIPRADRSSGCDTLNFFRGLATKARDQKQPQMSKYQVWYDAIIDRARTRKLNCYSEWHHIKPRSHGGNDDPSNLVELTYREHFLAHWLLTKLHSGGHLRRMQLALSAMTMNSPGKHERDIRPWQTEAARLALDWLEVDAEADEIWRNRFTEARKQTIELRFNREMQWRRGRFRRVEANRAALGAALAEKKKFTTKELKSLSDSFLKAERKTNFRGLHPLKLKTQMREAT